MIRRSTGRTKPHAIGALAVVVALLAVGLPASLTGANLTNAKSTTSTVTTAGDWCAVPPTVSRKNIYRLNDFTAIDAPETATTSTRVRMLVLPVANVADYAPVGGKGSVPSAQTGQLGVRLWSCSDPSRTNAATIKATAWRGSYVPANLNWTTSPTDAGSLAGARLNASGALTSGATKSSTRAGNELRDLHRGKNTQAGTTAAGTNEVTMRYSWILTNGRNELAANHQKAPVCTTMACAVTPATGGDGSLFADSFSHDESASLSGAVLGNSTTYLANKYYATGGSWPSTTKDQLQCSYRDWFGFGQWSGWADTSASLCPESNFFREYRSQTIQKTGNSETAVVTPTILETSTASTDAVLQDKTGSVVQYVVIEWWGGVASTTNGTMPTDLEIEVFVN